MEAPVATDRAEDDEPWLVTGPRTGNGRFGADGWFSSRSNSERNYVSRSCHLEDGVHKDPPRTGHRLILNFPAFTWDQPEMFG